MMSAYPLASTSP